MKAILTNTLPAISSGVERKLQHAHEAAKEVYVIWPAKQHPSVFITQTANAVFSSMAEATEFFQKRYPPEEAGIATNEDQ
jgi:hypothetical protein